LIAAATRRSRERQTSPTGTSAICRKRPKASAASAIEGGAPGSATDAPAHFDEPLLLEDPQRLAHDPFETPSSTISSLDRQACPPTRSPRRSGRRSAATAIDAFTPGDPMRR
jgi:hypothetical protein